MKKASIAGRLGAWDRDCLSHPATEGFCGSGALPLSTLP